MTPRTQSGSTIFEVMMSIFVISLGFLGFAKLEANSLSLTNSSLLRGTAVYLSYEMTDRMRANLPAVQAGAYNTMISPVADPGCIATGCSSTQVAQNDYYEWTAEAASLLPVGKAVVCIDSTPDDGTPGAPACDGAGNAFAVKVWWTEKSTQFRFATGFRP